MKIPFPLIAAIGLVILWTSMLFAIPFVLGQFADFKVEMPALTHQVQWVSHLFGGAALPMLVLATALLLGFRQFLGWVYALVLCVAWDLAFLGLLMFVITLITNLSGSSTTTPPLAQLPMYISLVFGSVQGVLAMLALLLNQVLFVSLIVKRRDFGR
ncbi:hypothetical protein IAD21_01692 [Abditibacteriota bacterium]|nr:hypothetical protein IAD21_01692 [Abditibacteriota bacterium]